MTDDNGDQTVIPRSFIDLFIDPGRLKPRETRAVIAERYEYCEDLAQMLTETAQSRLWELGVARSDVLDRIRRGLQGSAAGVDRLEAQWVMTRLIELLGWSDEN